MGGSAGQLTRAIALIGRQRSQTSAPFDGLGWQVGSRFMFIGSDLRSVLQHIEQ